MSEQTHEVLDWPKWWQFWRRRPEPRYRDSFATAWTGKQPRPDGSGKWRFSRFDGRFVFDYDDGRKGFKSPTWYDVDPFAIYVTDLVAALTEAQAGRERAEADTAELHGTLDRTLDERNDLKTRLAGIKQVIRDIDLLATKETDKDEFILAYRFNTGAWHRLLGIVNGGAEVPAYVKQVVTIETNWMEKANAAEAEVGRLREALTVIAEERLYVPLDGLSTTCQNCGFQTWHEKDGQVEHFRTCSQQLAATALLPAKDERQVGTPPTDAQLMEDYLEAQGITAKDEVSDGCTCQDFGKDRLVWATCPVHGTNQPKQGRED